MQLLIGKRPLLVVQLEAVAGDRNGVDVVAIVVWLDVIGLDSQRHPRRYWVDCHPQRWLRQDCRLRGNNYGGCRLRDSALEYFSEVNNGLLLCVAELGKRSGRGWVGDGLHQGTRCNDGCVDVGVFRHWTLVRKNCTVLAVRSDLVFRT